MGIPTFDTKNVSARVAVGQLADHITSNNTDWTKIEQVTMQSASLGFLSYLTSVIQGSINAKLSYECHSDDGDIILDSFVERPVRDGPWSARVSGREAPRAVGC